MKYAHTITGIIFDVPDDQRDYFPNGIPLWRVESLADGNIRYGYADDPWTIMMPPYTVNENLLTGIGWRSGQTKAVLTLAVLVVVFFVVSKSRK